MKENIYWHNGYLGGEPAEGVKRKPVPGIRVLAIVAVLVLGAASFWIWSWLPVWMGGSNGATTCTDKNGTVIDCKEKK